MDYPGLLVYDGLLWTIVDYRGLVDYCGLSWIRGPSWIIVDYRGLSRISVLGDYRGSGD